MSNIHEQIDRFMARTPRQKTLAAMAIAAVVLAILGGVFYLGVTSGHGWAESKYTRERDKRLAEIARHLENEKQMAAENALLKKQNEAVAEILAGRDKARAAEAAQKFAELQAEKNRRLHEIDIDGSFDSQLCRLCLEAAASGFPLSEGFCNRCDR